MLINWKEHQAVVNGLNQQLKLLERRCTSHAKHIDYLVKQYNDERGKHRQELDHVSAELVSVQEDARKDTLTIVNLREELLAADRRQRDLEATVAAKNILLLGEKSANAVLRKERDDCPF